MTKILKGIKIINDMPTCRSCNSDKLSTSMPMRFAGICTMYSKKAIPQLNSAAIYKGLDARYLRCKYHALSMNMLDTTSSRMVLVSIGKFFS